MPNTKLDLQWLEQMEKPWRKKKKERLEKPHLRPRGCEIRQLSNGDGMESWGSNSGENERIVKCKVAHSQNNGGW